jgi:hypothetical protein
MSIFTRDLGLAKRYCVEAAGLFFIYVLRVLTASLYFQYYVYSREVFTYVLTDR